MQFLFTLIEVALIVLGTLYLFRQYPNKQVHLAVKAICFTSWFISFIILILVPLDLIYTLGDHADTAVNPATAHASYKAMTIVWEVVYWTSFIFTWLVLPLLQEYVDAGDFSALDRLKRSIKVNVAIYAAMGLFGVIFIFYLKVSGRVEEEGIPHFLITFSNCFGIVLIILCLSYGLVFIPKRCFQQTRQRYNLKIHQFQMAVIDGERNNIIFRFEGLIKTIVQLLNREDVSVEDKAMLKEILVIAPIGFVEEVEEMTRNSGYPAGQSVEKVTKTKIASLHKKMKKKVNEMKRIEMRWQVTLRKASFLEDVINAKNPTEWRTKRSYTPPPYQLRDYEKSLSVIQWLWHAYLSRVAAFLVGLVCIAASAVVFFAEIMNFDDLHIFDIETYIRRGSGTVSKSQFLCLIPLFYISICVYSALFNMRLAGRYGLYRHHQTDAGSLVFASLNFSRVSSPLVFNFLQMLQINNTAFHSVMGNVQFAYSFMTYFPVLLIVLILCNVFDIYARVLDSFGLKRFKFNEESTIEKIEEGKKLLLKARIRTRSDSGNTFNGRSGQKQEAVEDGMGSTKEPSPIKSGYMLQNTELVGPIGRSLQDI